MKKRNFRILLGLLAALMLLSSCSAPPVMEYKNGVYYNKESNIGYRPASANYEAENIVVSNVVSYLSKSESEDDCLYEIKGADPALLLGTRYNDLFCADGYTLPTLRQMESTRVLFTQTVVLTASLVQIEKTDVIERLVEISEGQGFDENEIIFEDGTVRKYAYRLKFQSEKYPSFYYVLEYRKYTKDIKVWEPIDDPNNFEISYTGVATETVEEDGEWYAVYNFGTDLLVDHATKTCYPLGDTLAEYYDELDASVTGAKG